MQINLVCSTKHCHKNLCTSELSTESVHVPCTPNFLPLVIFDWPILHFRGELRYDGGVSQQKVSVDQSEPEKYVMSRCQTYYMEVRWKTL